MLRITITESPTLPGNRGYRETTVFFAKRPFPGELPLNFAIFGKKPLKNWTKAQISVNFPRAEQIHYSHVVFTCHTPEMGNVT